MLEKQKKLQPQDPCKNVSKSVSTSTKIASGSVLVLNQKSHDLRAQKSQFVCQKYHRLRKCAKILIFEPKIMICMPKFKKNLPQEMCQKS